MHIWVLLSVFAGAVVLSACGETREQQAATGALGGAVAGEVAADEPLLGAAAGGLAGAAGVGQALRR